MTVLWKAIRLIAIFAAGAVLGPVMIAGIAALDDEKASMPPQQDQAALLIRSYQANLPSLILFRSIFHEPHPEQCGYDETKLFPDGSIAIIDARESGRLSPIEGYMAINIWAAEQQNENYLYAITERIRKEHSPFEMEFLRRCIQSTIFSGICMKHVSQMGDRVKRFPDDPRDAGYFPGSGYEEEVICTYLDGVAARRGIALPERN